MSIEKIHEEINLEHHGYSPILSEVAAFFLWELFIYTTSLFLEYRLFGELREMLVHTYFLRDMIGTRNQTTPCYYRDIFPKFDYFTSRHGEVNQNGEPKPHVRDLAKNRITYPGISYESLVSADLFLSHYDMTIPRDASGWWNRAPLLAGYCHNTDSKTFWKRLISESVATEVMPLFGISSIDDLKAKIKEMQEAWRNSSAARVGLEFGGVDGINVNTEEIASRP